MLVRPQHERGSVFKGKGHLDYFIQAPVGLFMLDNCVEIISPGNLPNHLTVEKIRSGNSVIRKSVLASYAAKGVLP